MFFFLTNLTKFSLQFFRYIYLSIQIVLATYLVELMQYQTLGSLKVVIHTRKNFLILEPIQG